MPLTDYLFNTPWWLPTVILVVGAVVFYVANNRQETRTRTVGLAIACLGILLAAVSYLVDTDLEKAETQTRRLVDAVEKRDWPTVRSLLDNNTSVSVANAMTLYTGGDRITAKAEEASNRYGFQSIDITSMQSRQDQTLITITANVLSVQDVVGAPVTSRWEFDYLQSGDEWYLNEIRAIEIGRQQGEGVVGMFPKR